MAGKMASCLCFPFCLNPENINLNEDCSRYVGNNYFIFINYKGYILLICNGVLTIYISLALIQGNTAVVRVSL